MMIAAVECQACQREFSRSRLPLNLQCGHSICSSCITQDQSVVCPECRSITHRNDTGTLSINFPLARIIESGGLRPPPTPLLATRPPPPPPPPSSWGPCGRHGNPVLYFCNSCQTWICEDCRVVDHPPLPRGNCRTLEWEPAIERIRLAYHEHVQQLLEECDNFGQKLYLHINISHFCKQYLEGISHEPWLKYSSDHAIYRYHAFRDIIKERLNSFTTAPQETPSDLNRLITQTHHLTKWMKSKMCTLDVEAKPLKGAISYLFRRVSILYYLF